MPCFMLKKQATSMMRSFYGVAVIRKKIKRFLFPALVVYGSSCRCYRLLWLRRREKRSCGTLYLNRYNKCFIHTSMRKCPMHLFILMRRYNFYEKWEKFLENHDAIILVVRYSWFHVLFFSSVLISTIASRATIRNM